MRDFFGNLHCECLSFELVLVPVTTPDHLMEITGHRINCVSCSVIFHEPVDIPVRHFEGHENHLASRAA